ncbi:MAG: YraN family protein [Planctomycetota bacterium]|nr:MAG: YraN family protein [Planctomycetota bacterium]
MDRRELGARAEDAAVDFLKRKGMRILGRNLRTRRGEIDCIALDKKTLVFVEVKAQTGAGGTYPEEKVTTAKQRRLARLALEYMRKNRVTDTHVRFDVVAVTYGEGEPEIYHIPNAFDADIDI